MLLGPGCCRLEVPVQDQRVEIEPVRPGHGAVIDEDLGEEGWAALKAQCRKDAQAG